MSDLSSYSITLNQNIFYEYYKNPPMIINKNTQKNLKLPSLNKIKESLNLNFNFNKDFNFNTEIKSTKSLTCLDNYYYGESKPFYNNYTHQAAAIIPEVQKPKIGIKETVIIDTFIPKDTTKEATKEEAKQETKESRKRRRQRTGPSCDSCRSRKIKCTAEIEILSSTPSNLSSSEITQLNNENIVQLTNGWKLIKTHFKIIKFKDCTACFNKGKECFFSKGFTKDDIIIYNRLEKLTSSSPSSPSSQSDTHSPILEPNTMRLPDRENNINKEEKKHSCLNCRKRKVKCVYVDNHCENCFKKGIDCVIERKK